MLYPLTFRPIFKERVWGGRNLERLYHKALPHNVPIGESWEISDRPGDISVIANGPLAGKDLHWLLEDRPKELVGSARPQNGRFPLLIKILDAQEKLSLQVHPPPVRAVELGGEPKTEMWYIADAAPAAELYVGLRHGVTKVEFERRIQDGTVAHCVHHNLVSAGDAMFLPSGRVHAIGAGLVLFEIQQNSDTTYRVFDWNRVGLDGQPRELHVSQSLESINFNDFDPSLIRSEFVGDGPVKKRSLIHDPLFSVEVWKMEASAFAPAHPNHLQIFAVLQGKLVVQDGSTHLELLPGQFCLLPAALSQTSLHAESQVTLLRAEAGT